jgi:hypothetical protein
MLPGGHVFEKHAHEWFGVQKKGYRFTVRQVQEFVDVIQRVGRSDNVFPHTLRGGSEAVGHLAHVDGRWVVVFYYKDTGLIAYMAVPSRGQLIGYMDAIRRVKGK